MPFRTRSISFDLSPISIDRASDWFVKNQSDMRVNKEDCIRARLLLEEALLNMAEHFGKEHRASARLENHVGSYRLRLTAQGERFNPTRSSHEDDEWSTSLFSIIGMHIQYHYSMGVNEVRISLPKPRRNPVLRILIAVVIASALGALGNYFLPNELQETIARSILNPIGDMWIRLLQAISGPVIFFTALSAAFDTKRISDYGGSRFKVLARYFMLSVVFVVITVLCSYLIDPFEFSFSEMSFADLSKMLANILKIVPENLFEPFNTANTPQILLIAIVAGYVLAAMGPKVTELKTIIRQINLLGLLITERACSFVPYFVGIILCLRIWTHESNLLGLIWIPLAASAALAILFLLIYILKMAVRMHVSPFLLMRKLSGPFIATLKKGALDFSSVDDLANSCESMLGVDGNFGKAVLPQGLVLCMPTSAIGICVFVLFAAQAQGIHIDQMWLLSAMTLAVILAVATPPLIGANLLAFVVAFSYLGIADSAFLDVMVFDILFGAICIAIDQCILQLETVLQADRMGLLNVETLRAPIG